MHIIYNHLQRATTYSVHNLNQILMAVLTLNACVQNIFGASDSYSALLWSTFFVSIVTWVFYRMQYVYEGGTQWMFHKHKDAVPMMHLKGAHSLPSSLAEHLQSMIECDSRCGRRDHALILRSLVVPSRVPSLASSLAEVEHECT